MSLEKADQGPDGPGPRRVFLTPGTLYCGASPALVTTVLGSCVAVCLMSRYDRAAGMNHFVLPNGRVGENSLRYGDIAMQRLHQRMAKLGCHPDRMLAKVFGGAAVLPSADPSNTIGPKNVEIAMEWLRQHNVPVIARRTGGTNGLLIRLETTSGQVFVREVASSGSGDSEGSLPRHDSNRAYPFEAAV